MYPYMYTAVVQQHAEHCHSRSMSLYGMIMIVLTAVWCCEYLFKFIILCSIRPCMSLAEFIREQPTETVNVNYSI